MSCITCTFRHVAELRLAGIPLLDKYFNQRIRWADHHVMCIYLER